MKRRKAITPTNINDVLSIIQDIRIDHPRPNELQRTKDQYEGGTKAIGNRYFSAPTPELAEMFERERKHMTHVNLVQPFVRTWQSIVASPDIVRNIKKIPNDKIVKPYIESYDYRQTISHWVENAFLYGTACAVPMFDKESQELRVWLPDPLKTVIVCDPKNVYKPLLVAEINDSFVQFASKWGEGFFDRETKVADINHRSYSYLPVSIAYGMDRRHNREIYGLGLCTSAVDMSIRQTAVAFNVTILQKTQCKSIMLIIADPAEIEAYRQSKLGVGSDNNANMVIPRGSDGKILSHDPKITESIEVSNMFNDLFAVTSSIPGDIISNRAQSPSAEAARIRASSMKKFADILIPMWENNELSLMHNIAYTVDYHKSNEGEISLADIKARTEISITNNAEILPISPNEKTANDIQLVASGIKKLETAIKEHDKNLTPEEVDQMVKDYHAKISKASPDQVAQASMQAAAEALTDQQKAEKENAA